MSRRRPAITLFAVWTLFVWAVRLRNVWSAPRPVIGAILPLTLLALAVAVLVRPARQRVRLLALWTVAVWVLRTPFILLDGDRGAGFKVVHVVLAALSVALAVRADRESRRALNRTRAARRGRG